MGVNLTQLFKKRQIFYMLEWQGCVADSCCSLCMQALFIIYGNDLELVFLLFCVYQVLNLHLKIACRSSDYGGVFIHLF